MGVGSRAYQVLHEEGIRSFVKKSVQYSLEKGHRIILQVGSARECPICGFTGRRFLPAGDPKRPEVLCPRCSAAERHRLLWYYIENETDILERDGRVLYVSPQDDSPRGSPPGNRPIEEKLRKYRKVVTADIVMEEVDVHTDITQLAFSDESFETIICSHVLEHIPDDSEAIKELKRVLAADGQALIMIPKDKDREKTIDYSLDVTEEELSQGVGHVHDYGTDFPEYLKKFGFDVAVETYGKQLSKKTLFRHGLAYRDVSGGIKKNEDIHVGKK